MNSIKAYFAPGRQPSKTPSTRKSSHQTDITKASVSPKTLSKGSPGTFWASSEPTPPYSPSSSRAPSIYPIGDFRNAASDEINEIKCDVMANWLHSQQEEMLWTNGELDEGIILKKGRGRYTCCPADLADYYDGLFTAVEALNVRVSVRVTCQMVSVTLTKAFIGCDDYQHQGH